MELKDMEYYEAEGIDTEDIDDGAEASEELYRPGRKKKERNGLGFMIAGIVMFLLSATMLALVFLHAGGEFLNARGGEISASTVEFEAPPEVTYTASEVELLVAEAEEQATLIAGEKAVAELQGRFYEASQEDSGVLKLLRELYPDQMVYITGSKYEYYPIFQDLAKNTIDNECIVRDEENGRLSYVVDGNTMTYEMIDVSSFQKTINWEKVKASGIDYAMIRCAFRGYGTGKIVDDPYFEENIKGATKAGVKVGVYFFSQATSREEAIEEAEYTLDLIAPYKIDLPIAIDVEDIADASRTDNMTADEISEASVAFMDRIREAGHETMIYSNNKYFIKNLNVEILEGYDKWYAQYNDSIYFPYEITAWQYSAEGRINGINGDVDLNIVFKEW